MSPLTTLLDIHNFLQLEIVEDKLGRGSLPVIVTVTPKPLSAAIKISTAENFNDRKRSGRSQSGDRPDSY
jgi:hypothetical protein